jgi:hypothetical protein
MGTMEDTLILNIQDIVQAQRATRAFPHHVLAEDTRRADGWMQLWSATRPTEPTR